MKVRVKILISLGAMILAVSFIMLLFMLFIAAGIRQNGKSMIGRITTDVEANVSQELMDLSKNISNYALALEAEIDRNMLNAANVLYEADRLSGGRLTLSDLERLKQQTGMSDLYLGDMNGIFTISTEPSAAGLSLFEIWDGYTMLVTGESDYLPSDLKIKAETGEIFKFTAIPRANNRGILESALDAGVIEEHLQDFINTNKGIRSMNLFDFSLFTLTENRRQGVRPVYTKGAYIPSGRTEVSDLFEDPSKIHLTLDHENAQVYYPVTDGGRVRYVLFIDVDTAGYFTAGNLMESSVTQLVSKISFLNTISLLFVFAVLLVSTGVIYIMINKLLFPLGVINTMFASFSKGDLTVKVPRDFTDRDDEMGEISVSFADTVNKLKHMLLIIKNEVSELSGVGNDLSSNMNETTAELNQITKNIHNIKEQILNQTSAVTNNQAVMEKAGSRIQELSEQIENQSIDVSRASSAIEQMVTDIISVTGTLEKNSVNVKTLSEASKTGKTGLQEVAADIQEIARESEGLLGINSVIQNIAGRTNLLAMNAAIEAAHAGESGQGFAVVADEIRKLAENSGNQSKTIAVVLKKIKESIDKIKKSTDNVLYRFESIDTNINIVTGQEENILSVMEKQEASSKNILEHMDNLNNITNQIKDGSHKMLTDTKDAITESVKLEKVSSEITMEINEMSDSAGEIDMAIKHINDISARNRQGIKELNNEVSRYKIE
jgi:methyl-accepting chemotaxis protein